MIAFCVQMTDSQFWPYLMSTAPGRWGRDVNLCPGVLSDTVDVEFIIHEGLQEASGLSRPQKACGRPGDSCRDRPPQEACALTHSSAHRPCVSTETVCEGMTDALDLPQA